MMSCTKTATTMNEGGRHASEHTCFAKQSVSSCVHAFANSAASHIIWASEIANVCKHAFSPTCISVQAHCQSSMPLGLVAVSLVAAMLRQHVCLSEKDAWCSLRITSSQQMDLLVKTI